MSAGSGGNSNQDFDLNLAPIIDCFTVLITYLLVSASFISLNSLDVGIAATGDTAAAANPSTPPLALTAELKDMKMLELTFTHVRSLQMMPSTYAQLHKHVAIPA